MRRNLLRTWCTKTSSQITSVLVVSILLNMQSWQQFLRNDFLEGVVSEPTISNIKTQHIIRERHLVTQDLGARHCRHHYGTRDDSDEQELWQAWYRLPVLEYSCTSSPIDEETGECSVVLWGWPVVLPDYRSTFAIRDADTSIEKSTQAVRSSLDVPLVAATRVCRSCGNPAHMLNDCPVLYYTDINNDHYCNWSGSIVGKAWLANSEQERLILPGYENRESYHPAGSRGRWQPKPR